MAHETSKIAGTRDVFLSVRGTDIRSRFNRSVTPTLWVRCHEKTTSVLVTWGVFLGSDETRVEWRIDESGRKTGSWRISSDHEASGLWSGAGAIPFIRTLLARETLAMRVIPYGEAPVETVFPIAGLQEKVGEVMSACSWK